MECAVLGARRAWGAPCLRTHPAFVCVRRLAATAGVRELGVTAACERHACYVLRRLERRRIVVGW